MAEYAVVLGVITIAVVVTLGLLSTAIKNLRHRVAIAVSPAVLERAWARRSLGRAHPSASAPLGGC